MQTRDQDQHTSIMLSQQPELPPGWQPGIPLIRVSTCGRLRIELLQEVPDGDAKQAHYVELPPERLQGRGPGPALTVLKLLISQPERAASKDWLMTHLRQDEMEVTRRRMENIVSCLRGLLCLPTGQRIPDVLLYVRASAESGDGYRLADYPLVWLDTDALAWQVKRACLLEHFQDDAFPHWQRAYQLASRGTYLLEEPYSQWAQPQRERVEGYLRQSVHALSRLLLARLGEAGEEEVIRLLRDYWLEHPADEDALWPLLELLGKHGQYQEALAYYDRLCEVLEEQGLTKGGHKREPDQRTRELADYLRVKQRRSLRAQPTPALPSGPSHLLIAATAHPPKQDEPAPPPPPPAGAVSQPLLTETRHLLGREDWLASIVQMVQGSPPRKLIILHGPIGIGKSSEMSRLATHFLGLDHPSYRVFWIPLLPMERVNDPEAALDVVLGTLLSESGQASFPAQTPRRVLMAAVLTFLERQPQPTVIMLDNAECLLTEEGKLAPCWEAFLTQFLRRHHQVTLFLATKAWQGWSGRDGVLVAETTVPPLTVQESVALLQRLGLETVPLHHLQAISERVAGIPLCLEWLAKLATDPLILDDWQGIDEEEPVQGESCTRRIAYVLEHPTLLGAHLASHLIPLLQHIMDHYLSQEAREVLTRLAVATLPLGKPALQVLCPRPALLKELRDASLLVAYAHRVQLLPMVAATVQQQLPSEQRHEVEELVIQAYTRWLEEGHLEMQEAGSVVTELASLLLTHHQLLNAAQLFIRYGWMSFQLGYGPRLARLACNVMDHEDWHRAVESECAGLVLIQTVFSFLGRSIETKKHVNYQRIRDAFLEGRLTLQAATEGYVLHLLLLDAINELRFTEAQALLDAYHLCLEACQVHPERHESWLQKQALLFGAWCEYLEEVGETEQARAMREQAIMLYRERAALLSDQERKSPLKRSLRIRGLASCFSYLGYHLHRMGHDEEALQVIEQAITLQEQGYGNIGILASSYSDKSQILIGLGRLQEAIIFDEKAMAEIQRCADAGDALSQEDKWTYMVNRGRLYVRLGRVEEAEQLFLDALPRLHAGRRKYRMFAKESLDEIEQWRRQALSPQYQIDWRWIERYRQLCSYDSYWWLTWAGPFTEEEQVQWERLFALPLDEVTKTQLAALMKQSRERELEAAIREQREPHLWYPAIAIEDVRQRIAAQLQLKEEIAHHEPNAVVRRLYQGTIEEELDYLHLIEATYERNTERFRDYSLRLFPLPTHEEMFYALTHIQQTLIQGLNKPETALLSQQIQDFVQTHLHLALSLDLKEEEIPQQQQHVLLQPQEARTISAQTAQRFFEAILKENSYDGWKVIIDANATGARVEQGARCLFLPEKDISLTTVKHLFAHELAGHVARCVAGERSLLGLLGIHTKNVSWTEEGLVLYHERQIAVVHGQSWDDSGMKLSTLAIGLAHGIMTPPQTFHSICSFVESFSLLRRLLRHPEKDREQHQKQARRYALDHCLRVFRGVPDLTQAGVCYPQDAIYLHGLFKIEKAVAEDQTILDRLAVGKVALELLPELQELGLTTTTLPSLYPRAYDPELDAYILSFEEKQASDESS